MIASLAALTVVVSALLLSGWAGSRAVADAGDAPQDGLVAERRFESAALGRTMPYVLYMPPGYASAGATERYPVLYLLHSRGDSHRSWADYGLRSGAARTLRLWIDIDSDDPWLPAAARFHAQLANDATYWRDHMTDYLTYYSSAFREQDIPDAAGSVQSSLSPA